MTGQTEFDLGALDVDAVLSAPGLDTNPLDDKWPQTLAEAVDVLVADFRRRGFDDEAAVGEAQRAVLVLANHQGGRQIYWPRGDALQSALQARQIYHLWNGRNKETLAKRFGLTVRSVERIFAEQYRLGIKRRQGMLFNEEGK